MGTPGFNIKIDYRFAPDNAFDEQAKQRIEEAARIWESFIADDFEDIPAGTLIRVRNPQTDATETITLTDPVDDLIIFVGAAPLVGAAAKAGPINTFNNASLNERFNSTDFEPGVGFVTFDPNFSGFANLGLALHEIGHVLGIGPSPEYGRRVVNQLFDGPNARAINGGNPIPVNGGHIASGFVLPNGLRPNVGGGIGSGLPTIADLAILADIGYEVPALTTPTTPPSTLNYSIKGTSGDDFISGFDGSDILLGLAGNDSLRGFRNFRDPNGDYPVNDQGDRLDGGLGNDSLRGEGGDDLLIGGRGDDTLGGGAGRDRFAFGLNSGEDYVFDFVVADDIIQVSPDYGFATPAAAFATLDTPRPVISNGVDKYRTNLNLNGTDVVTILSDLPLQAANLVIAAIPNLADEIPPPPGSTPDSNPETSPDPGNNPTPSLDRIIIGTRQRDRLRGGNGNDTIKAKGNNDKLWGDDGDDLLRGGGGKDKLRGGDGTDKLIGNGGNDILWGNGGNDLLKGGGGKDKLRGGLGDDTLIGGGKRDIFFLEKGQGVDTIRGFRLNQDVFKLGAGVRLNRLDFTQQGRHTLVSLRQDDLATVLRSDAEAIANATFF